MACSTACSHKAAKPCVGACGCRLQDQGLAKDGEWGSIMQQPLFRDAGDEGSASLSHLTALYVERHHTLWKVGPCSWGPWPAHAGWM